jgi:hypothetical protein
VADISYALYLWHWPLLIAYLHYTDRDRVDWLGAAAIMAASVVLSWLTNKLVADPAQRFRVAFGGVRALVAAAVCVSLVAGSAVVGLTLLERRDAALLAAASEAAEAAAEQTGPSEYPGARALSPRYSDPVPHDVPVQPAPVVAAQDRPAVDGDGCIESNTTTSATGVPLTCVLTDAPDPDRVVVMVGDSHTIQWTPAMTEIGRTENWRVLLLARRGCRLAVPAEPLVEISACWQWRAKALDLLKQMRPDAVMVIGSRTSPTATGDQVHPDEARAWRQLEKVGIRTVTIRDNPRFEFDVPACVEESGGSACARPRSDVYVSANPVGAAPGVPRTAAHLDLTPFICGPQLCEAVAGNVLIYRDDDHLTATYVTTLEKPLHRALRTRAQWLFADPMNGPLVRQRY